MHVRVKAPDIVCRTRKQLAGAVASRAQQHAAEQRSVLLRQRRSSRGCATRTWTRSAAWPCCSTRSRPATHSAWTAPPSSACAARRWTSRSCGTGNFCTG